MEQLLSAAFPLATHSVKEGNPPSVMFLQHNKGYYREVNIHRCEILCVLKGSMVISYENFYNEEINAGTILLLPPGLRGFIRMKEKIDFIVLQPQETGRLCEEIQLEELPVKDEHSSQLPILSVNAQIHAYLKNLQENLIAGVCLPDFFDIKVKEFFYLLKAYYSKEEQAIFFNPLYSRNASFAMFILKNHRYVKTVREFAQLYNCSVSYFDKHFREAFGTSTYKWMLRRKIDFIYHEITTTRKSFKQVAVDSGFGSQPQFTDFCKKHLGNSPGELRRKNEYKINLRDEI